MLIDQHELRVYSGATQLEPVESAGQITADRGWSPHVQGRLTVRPPASDASTAPGSTLTIELTQRFGDVGLVRDLTVLWCGAGRTLANLTALVCGAGRTIATLTGETITATQWNSTPRAATGRTFHLVVTSRTRSRDEHTLELASTEATIQDWVWYDIDGNREGVPVTFEADTPARFLRAVIDAHKTEHDPFGYWESLVIVDRSTPRAITPLEHTIQAGEGTIAALETFLTQARQRLYSPGDGTILVADYPYTSAGPLTLAHGSNLIDWEVTDERTREAMIRFTGTATDPAARPIYHSRTFPELFPPPEQMIEAPHPPILLTGIQSGIANAIQPYLDRVGLDASPVRLVTVNDYSASPGSPVAYTLPGASPVNESADAITWRLGGRWQMDIWI